MRNNSIITCKINETNKIECIPIYMLASPARTELRPGAQIVTRPYGKKYDNKQFTGEVLCIGKLKPTTPVKVKRLQKSAAASTRGNASNMRASHFIENSSASKGPTRFELNLYNYRILSNNSPEEFIA